MNPTNKRVLLAVDGSDQSLDAVRYVSNALSSENTEVVLFHVMKNIDDAFWDIGRNPAFSKRIADVRGWEIGRHKIAEEFMNRARQILLNAGFASQAVKVNIHQRDAGVARDIAKESTHGYSAVVIGRRGLNAFKDFVFGSVARKLIGKLTHVPVWVVGAKPQPGKVLIALDASGGATKAVDHIGTMLAKSDCNVTLLHVIRGLNIDLPISELPPIERREYLSPSEEEEWLDEETRVTAPMFDEATACLIDAGFAAERITTKLVTRAGSRARSVVEEARQGGYGTIAMGRRGMSNVKEFLVGSVSDKVLHLATEMAVCVVS